MTIVSVNVLTKNIAIVACSLFLLIHGAVIQAQDDEDFTYDYDFNLFDRLKLDYQLNMHSSSLFGDKFDNGTGTIRFEYTDVSLPGNFDIEVAFRRSYKTTGPWQDRGWKLLEIPRIEYQLVLNSSNSALWPDNWPIAFQEEKHCSGANFGADWILAGGSPFGAAQQIAVDSDQFNLGPKMIIPGQLSEQLIYNDSTLPISASPYRFTTKSQWRISCIPQQDGTGEGFRATSPNGITYTFDVAELSSTINEIDTYFGAYPLVNLVFGVSKVEDRFGNWVQYNRSADGRVTSITSSDNRSIGIEYSTVGYATHVSKVIANGREWLYEHESPSSSWSGGLKVTLPDGRFWNYAMRAHTFNDVDAEKGSANCNLAHYDSIPGANEHPIIYEQGTDPLPLTPTITIKHPDGATGQFWLGYTKQGRTNLDSDYDGDPRASRCSFQYSLLKKSIFGPSFDESTWLYEYSNNDGHYSPSSFPASQVAHWSWTSTQSSGMELTGALPSNIDNFNYKWIKTIKPDGSYVKTYVNRDASSYTEGSVYTEEYFSATGQKLKEVQNTYVAGTIYGPHFFNTSELDHNYSQTPKLTKTVTTLLNGSVATSYTKEYSSFDLYDKPQIRYEHNSYSTNKRYLNYEYFSDTSNWLLSLPGKIKLSANGTNYTTAKEVTYHSAIGSYKSLPNCTYGFGQLFSCNESYHTNGNLKKLAYNTPNYWVEFDNYKRGEPQTIKTPSSTSTTPQYVYMVIDDNGWKTQTTDFNGNVTNYTYNSVGWMTGIIPSDTNWISTTIDYLTATGTEGIAGVTAGMLLQKVTKGNYQKSHYLDNWLRPHVTVEEDTSVATTRSYINYRYDAFNNLTFESYPSATSGETKGTSYLYDGLQRKVQTIVNTGTSQIQSLDAYQAGNKITSTDFNSNVTTITYLAYGSPNYKKALTIASPENVTTDIVYNLFDRLTSVSQGGITQHNVYDQYQRLCKEVRPDIGNRAFSYNALGQLSWQAHGSSVNSSLTACDTTVTASEQITFAYDNLGNIETVNYGDSATPDLSYTYDANNNLKTLTAGGVSWSYDYNSIDLLEKETLALDGKTYVLDPAYNSLGYLDTLLYPSGRTLSYTTNALGQVTAVGNYVTNATYHPNGYVNTITYGNGVTHTATVNTRQLPQSLSVQNATGTALSNLTYGYDNNANVEDIFDAIDPTYDISFEYDGLDRLTIANGYWGSGSFSYDAMGNILTKQLGSHSLTYDYDAATKMLDYVNGSKYYAFSYDSRGNVMANGHRDFIYNLANQMTSSSGISYVYDGFNRRVKKTVNSESSYSVYSNGSGKLMYRQKANGDHVDHLYMGNTLIGTVESR